MPRLKAALNLANFVLGKWGLNLNGMKAKIKQRGNKWVIITGVERELERGWELGKKCEAKLIKRINELSATGLGICFTAME